MDLSPPSFVVIRKKGATPAKLCYGSLIFGDYFLDSVVESHSRPPSQQATDEANVRDEIACFDAGGVRWPLGKANASSSSRLNHKIRHVGEGDSRAAADVEDHSVGCWCRPRKQTGVDHVVDMDVIPNLCSGTIDRQILPGDRSMNEPVDDPITILLAPLERTVWIGDSKYDRIDASEPVVKHVIVLADQLVDSIHRYRSCGCGFIDWHSRCRLVNEPRTWKDHLDSGGCLTARLKDGQLAAHVDVQIFERRGVAGDRARSPCEVEEDVASCQSAADRNCIANITLDTVDALQ